MSKKPTKQELIDHVESLVAKCEELTRERDEARRPLCYKQYLSRNCNFSPELIAELTGWDRFEENTDE